jgi:C1A family cysteine protease
MSHYYYYKKQDLINKYYQELIQQLNQQKNIMNKKKLNYKHNKNHKSKTVVSTKKTTTKVVDLSQYCSSVKDQGNEGSCTAFASLACMEFLEKKFNTKHYVDLSEQFTYYATRFNVMKENPVTDSGAYISDVITSLIQYGTCTLAQFPYVDNPLLVPSQAIYNQAKVNTVIQYANIISFDVLKYILSFGYAVVCGFICYSNIYNTVNGIIPISNYDIIGGHAVLLVGYDDNKKLFKLYST